MGGSEAFIFGDWSRSGRFRAAEQRKCLGLFFTNGLGPRHFSSDMCCCVVPGGLSDGVTWVSDLIVGSWLKFVSCNIRTETELTIKQDYFCICDNKHYTRRWLRSIKTSWLILICFVFYVQKVKMVQFLKKFCNLSRMFRPQEAAGGGGGVKKLLVDFHTKKTEAARYHFLKYIEKLPLNIPEWSIRYFIIISSEWQTTVFSHLPVLFWRHLYFLGLICI